MYQVGQAFITEFNDLGFITGQTKTTYNYVMLRFSDCRFSIGKRKIQRPATEAEILAEAVKHGWKENEIFFSPTGVISIGIKNGIWTYEFEYLEDIKNLSIFGQECIIAHRLIKALNLAK